MILEGDYDGQIYLAIPARAVSCDEQTLEVMLRDLGALCWVTRMGAGSSMSGGRPGPASLAAWSLLMAGFIQTSPNWGSSRRSGKCWPPGAHGCRRQLAHPAMSEVYGARPSCDEATVRRCVKGQPERRWPAARSHARYMPSAAK